MNVREELTKLLMESYDRGVKDATQAAIESIQEAMRLEREACAKLCDDKALEVSSGLHGQAQNDYFDGYYFARAIRARGKQ